MLDFLNTEEKNETVEQLMASFQKDPTDVCRALETRFEESRVTEKIEKPFLSEQRHISDFAKQMIETLTTLDQSLPVRRSVFRDREDSVRMYRAVVPFLSSLGASIKRFRSAMLAGSLLRDRAVQVHLSLTRTEWLCRELLKRMERDDYRERIAKLLEEVLAENEKLESMRTNLQDCIKTWKSFDTDVVLRFLQNAETALDAEHDGIACDCTKVIALLGELKRETWKLV